MKHVQALAFAGLLCMLGTAEAQLKLPESGTTPAPTAPAQAQPLEGQALKEAAARDAAEKWLALLDARKYGEAWDQTARAFRDKVKREQWVESLPKTRGALGAVKSRSTEVASFRPSLAGMPDGDYVTVRFSTRFEKKDEAQELVTLVYEGGAWRPLGYGV
jgi:hypothetical protein